MNSSWQSYLRLLPDNLKNAANKYRDNLQELRLRVGQSTEVVTASGSHRLANQCTCQELDYVINMASQYSPWSSDTLHHGYITAEGGHRVGICGRAVVQGSEIRGMRNPTSVCIRVARDLPVAGGDIQQLTGSILIIGAPGTGKTTLLRDLVRIRSNGGGETIGVVDERCEIFPHVNGVPCFPYGKSTDILYGCPKTAGGEILLRCMTPHTIVLDEITSESDCNGIMHISWCGVDVICTAHAADRKDLYSRPVYKPLVQSELFDWLIVMHPDKHYTFERMKSCT